MMKNFEGDGADRAGVIGLIRQGFVRVGLEADQPDRDRVSSDQGFLIGRSGCDRSDQGRGNDNEDTERCCDLRLSGLCNMENWKHYPMKCGVQNLSPET